MGGEHNFLLNITIRRTFRSPIMSSASTYTRVYCISLLFQHPCFPIFLTTTFFVSSFWHWGSHSSNMYTSLSSRVFFCIICHGQAAKNQLELKFITSFRCSFSRHCKQVTKAPQVARKQFPAIVDMTLMCCLIMIEVWNFTKVLKHQESMKFYYHRQIFPQNENIFSDEITSKVNKF